MNRKIVGTVESNGGTAFKVCIGFVPDEVNAFNVDGTADYPEIRWLKSMAAVSASAGGFVSKTGTTYRQMAAATAAEGISPYAGGDVLVYDSAQARWETEAGADATKLYQGYDGACIGTHIEKNPVNGQRIRVPAGFAVGTNADINGSSETIMFEASAADVLN